MDRTLNDWCKHHKISPTLPMEQKQILRELYYNPMHVPSEEIILSMLKATPTPLEHKRCTGNDWGTQNQPGWKKT